MIDLHTHSTASDGLLSPTELIETAQSEGLSAIALTDHDTVDGLDEAERAANRIGITFVAGIELEVDFRPGAFHLLGLGLRTWHDATGRRLERVRRFRYDRNLQMVARLQAAGLPVTYPELVEISGHQTVGRPHFAQLLVDKGVVSTYQEAFDELIGNGRPFYVRKKALGVGQSCAAIHAAGGVAVIAHPRTLQIGWDELDRYLKRWKHEGLDGLEAYHLKSSCNDGHRLAALATENELLVTAGSDFHAPGRNGARLGRTCEGMPIDDRFLAPLLKETRERN